ncbi:MAG: HD domain-containing protein, partial [Actinobacteria bacterium]
MRRLTLTQQFALRSLIFVVVMALALGVTITIAIRSLYETEAARFAQIAARTSVLDHLEGTSWASKMPPGAKLALDEMVSQDLTGTGIASVKLWNNDGTLVYASDGSEVGASYPDHEPLKKALAGEVTVEVSDEEGEAESRAQVAENGKVLEVYAPLRSRSGELLGVFEVYEVYDVVDTAVNRLIAIIWAIIILGSIPAYVLQVTLVNRAAKELTETQSDLAEVHDRLQGSLDELELHSLGTLQALVAAVDAKDSYTARHSIAVTDYAVAIGKAMKLSDTEMRDVERAGLLHDVGKIGTPEAILLKPERLTDAEFSVMSEHSEMGGHILESVPFLSELMPIVRAHHERWDGAGYPDGVAGENIPLLARVLAVADAFDAMTSERPYRTPVPIDVARAELVRCAGTQFDAVCV